MIPLSPGDMCPICRRVMPEAGTSRPFDAPLTDPIDVRALELVGDCTLESQGLPRAVRRTLIEEFGADDDTLLRTSHRIQRWLTYQAHEQYRREGS